MVLRSGIGLDETTRGCLGEWTGIFYSGSEKRAVTGLNVEALCAVVGDEANTAFDYAQQNENIKGSKVYWELNKAKLD